MKVIAYLVYGKQPEYRLELFLSVLSALRFLQDNSAVKICVVTDQKNLAPELPIEEIHISQEDLQTWTLNGAFYHRAKILAIMKVLDKYNSPVAFLDTDTIFLRSPKALFERISAVSSVMHRLENDQAIMGTDYWKPIFEKYPEGFEVQGLHVSPSSPMFNSGVIGVDIAHKVLLEKALLVLDKLCEIHTDIHTLEQFSLGLTLGKYTTLLESDDIVKHYWCKLERGFIHIQASRKLSISLESPRTEDLKEIDFERLGYPSVFIHDRFIARLQAIRKNWNESQRFSYLAYRSALSYAKEDTEIANQWARVALHLLRCETLKNKKTLGSLKIGKNPFFQFSHFSKEKLIQLEWMRSEVKNDWLGFWNSYDHTT